MLRKCLDRLPSAILLSVLLAVVSPLVAFGNSKSNQHPSGHHDLLYVIDEESETGKAIGDLAAGAGLNSRYPAEVVRQLRFRFLSPAPGFISVEETTGRLFISGRIDREAVCRPDTEVCRIQEDVAVQPVQYFHIIKVSKSRARAIRVCGSLKHS